MGLVAAEIRKYTTVRTTWVLTGIGWVLVALSTGFLLFAREMSGPFTGSAEQVAAAIDQIGSNSIIVLVVALLAMTTEFRHGTVGRTFQITPSRSRVLAAKLTAGAVYAVAFFASSLAIVAPALAIGAATNDVTVSLGPEVWTALWHGPLGLVLTAALGVALGALLRSQVVAITLALVWLFVGEQLINAFFPEYARWLPFQALNAVFLNEETLANLPEGVIAPLDPVVGLSVFVGYVAVAGLAALVLLRTRDV
jgi:ABC-2 type transport system permease protein